MQYSNTLIIGYFNHLTQILINQYFSQMYGKPLKIKPSDHFHPCTFLFTGHNSTTDKEDANNRMEIDFLIRKDTVTSRHNIIPIEAKSSSGYTITSLQKCVRKFGGFVISPTVVHSSDSRIDGDIRYLPLYMVPLL